MILLTNTTPAAATASALPSSLRLRAVALALRGLRRGVFFAETEGEAGGESDRISGRSVNARDGRRGRAQSRFEVVLGFVVGLVGKIVDVEIEVEAGPDGLRHGEIDNVEARSADGGICAIEAIVSNVAIAQRGVNAPPSGQRQPTIGDGVRRAIHVNPRRGRSIKRVRHLREAAVERDVTRQADRGLSFKTVSPARSFQFSRSVVGNINLLVRAIDEEQVARERE